MQNMFWDSWKDSEWFTKQTSFEGSLMAEPPPPTHTHTHTQWLTRSSWLNCALRDDEAVYLVSRGHYEAVAVGN